MIGIDQEPNDEAQAELKRLFGDGKYALRFSEQSGGTVVASITLYGEQAPKLLVHLATNATRPQVDAVWSEALQRYRKDHAQELAHARPWERPANPAPAGAAIDANGNEGEPGASASGERPGDAVEDRATVDSPNAPGAPALTPTPSTGPAGPAPTPTEPAPDLQQQPRPDVPAQPSQR